ncbi:MAG: hypothetical protein J7M09_05535 [Deltaproteobacteria bacterium]|nr:hypothetical protein [Candidatus Tharpella sp.]
MNMGNSQQHDRAEALIEKIQTDASEQAVKILASVNEQAEAITQEARRKARLKVHEVVEGLRIREEREMSHETARFETERRQWRQTDEMGILAEGLTHLEAALNGLWAEKGTREQWCHNVLAVAQKRLPADNWRLEHPADIPEDELAGLINEISTHTGTSPELSAENTLRAGLRIFAGTACVDGSSAAMTADRQGTSAKFLSIMLTMREEVAQ